MISPTVRKIFIENKRRMQYFPLDFRELNIDGLIGTVVLTSDIPEADLQKT